LLPAHAREPGGWLAVRLRCSAQARGDLPPSRVFGRRASRLAVRSPSRREIVLSTARSRVSRAISRGRRRGV